MKIKDMFSTGDGTANLPQDKYFIEKEINCEAVWVMIL